MGLIKDRNGMDLTEAEDIKKRWQEYWSDSPFPPPVNHVVRSYIIKGISYARRGTIRDRNDKALRRSRQD